jgi:hypothetical protein
LRSGANQNISWTQQQETAWQNICGQVQSFSRSLIPDYQPKHSLDTLTVNKQKLLGQIITFCDRPAQHGLDEVILLHESLDYFSHPQTVSLTTQIDNFYYNVTGKNINSTKNPVTSFWQGSDACAYRLQDDQALFAIADGVTNSRGGEILSHHLVKSFCDTGATGLDITENIHSAPEQWLRSIRDNAESYYGNLFKAVLAGPSSSTKTQYDPSKNVFIKKSRHEFMASTFVGLSLLPEDQNGKKKWSCVGVGDSLLFHFGKTLDSNGNETLHLKATYPIQSHPLTVRSLRIERVKGINA